MKKVITWALILTLALSLLAGCAGTKTDSDLAYVQDKGKLLVGITDYAPMDYKDENGQWIGFDADLSKLFAEELDVECEFVVLTDWSKKFYELETKNIDVIWNGMTITDEVKLNTNCSDPYVINAQVLVMKADVIGNYTTVESLSGLKFAVENGSAGQDALDDNNIKDYVSLQDQAAALMEVAAGTSDACVIDITMAEAMTGEGTSYANLAAGLRLTEEEYGVGFRKGSDITAKFNAFLDDKLADGTLEALAQKYNVSLVK